MYQARVLGHWQRKEQLETGLQTLHSKFPRVPRVHVDLLNTELNKSLDISSVRSDGLAFSADGQFWEPNECTEKERRKEREKERERQTERDYLRYFGGSVKGFPCKVPSYSILHKTTNDYLRKAQVQKGGDRGVTEGPKSHVRPRPPHTSPLPLKLPWPPGARGALTRCAFVGLKVSVCP